MPIHDYFRRAEAVLVRPRRFLSRAVAGALLAVTGVALVFGGALPTRAHHVPSHALLEEPEAEAAAETSGSKPEPDRPTAKMDRVGEMPSAEKTVREIASTPDIMGGFLVAMLGNVVRQAVFDDHISRVVKVRKGDTLMKIMVKAGIPRPQAYDAISEMRKLYDPRGIVPGQKITLTYRQDSTEEHKKAVKLEGFSLSASAERDVAVERGDDEKFTVIDVRKSLERRLVRARGKIHSSLYKAAAAAGVPPTVLVDLIRIYSWDVDFQRDIRSGDGFEVVFERFYSPEGELAGSGDILYASVTLGGESHKLYRFEFGDDQVDYFDQNGESARKPLMRTPIDGARLSSKYGRRRHPILGYNRMHRGVDFAANRGTPIYAAGDGTITYRGRKGAYGRYVRIRHNSRYSTAYGHLWRYKGGQRKGTRVRQGEVIGFVGSSGRATGPHLHYEVLVNGRQVNPLRVKMPPRRKLTGAQLADFHAARQATESLVAEMTPVGALASK